MERKEPTLSGGANNSGGVGGDRDDAPIRRSSSAYDEPRNTSRSSNTGYSVPTSSSPLPAIALVIGLVGVIGAAFLGWQLMELQAKGLKDAARITQLESQLDVTSTNSTQSVGALQINLQKVDGDLKKLQDVVRKLTSDHNDKFAAQAKLLDGAKTEITGAKGGINLLQQDSLAYKATFEEIVANFDAVEKNIALQSKKIGDVNASVNAMVGQLKSAEGLASRITKTEEAIDSIDDNRRTINKDLIQIKQMMGIKN